jgi:hypothetical protein
MIQPNSKCYRFEKIIFNDGLLSDEVNATYILHLENNGRYESIMEQLNEYHPTNIVYICYNKGYANCKKSEYINISSLDLVDTNLHILKHAKDHNYDNILVLEDDFIFNKKIKDKSHRNNIKTFVRRHENYPFMYLLGCIPGLQIPYNYYTNIVVSAGMHAVIFNKLMYDEILNENPQSIKDWDMYSNYKFKQRYTYYIPLCYQLFPETENQKTWGNWEGSTFIDIFGGNIFKQLLKLLQLDIDVEPGYTVLYIVSRIPFYLLLILIIWIIVKNLYAIKWNKLITPFLI